MPVAHISFVGANSFGHDEDGTVARAFSSSGFIEPSHVTFPRRQSTFLRFNELVVLISYFIG
jgi:hypothetical protein